MFLVDGPYVSAFLKETLYRNQFPVVRTKEAESFLDETKTHFVSEQEALKLLRGTPGEVLFTNSENALSWLYDRLFDLPWVQAAQTVKDKILFREKLREIHPDYQFSGHDLASLVNLDPEALSFPLILKPSVGFFSLGVQRVENQDHWEEVIAGLDHVVSQSEGLYPPGVLDNRRFVLESIIPGDEFAVDCYFDEDGKPVVLNLMQHLFASEAHMNDRVYFTSGQIMETYLESVSTYLERLAGVFALKNFPAHIEIRIHQGAIQAIEINPLRFGGWCSTADTAHHAWGLNLYEMLMAGERPDWPGLAAQHRNDIHALIVLDNSTGIPGKDIKNFDYKGLLETIAEPLELRPTNFKRFPLFGFLMCRVSSLEALKPILHSDLKEYVKC